MASDFVLYIFIGVVALLLLEQVICWFYVPYLGRFGITIHSRIEKVSIETIISRFLDKTIPSKLSMHKKEDAIFFKNRYSYNTLWMGPCVCAARIMEHGTSTVIIDVKMCPALFSIFSFGVLIAIIAGIINFTTIDAFLNNFLNIVIWFILMHIYYRVLLARVARLCLR